MIDFTALMASMTAEAETSSVTATEDWLQGRTIYGGLTAAFCLKRLRGTSRSPRHVLEIILTSIAIPFVAVYWRLVGAWRFRVFFL